MTIRIDQLNATYVPGCWSRWEWMAFSCAVWLSVTPRGLQAQFTDRPLAGEVAERKIDQLKLDDSLLRSQISGAQVARQAEIARLEGRILRIEEQLRDLPGGSSEMQLAFVLGLANEPRLASQQTDLADQTEVTNASDQQSPTEKHEGSSGAQTEPQARVIQEIVVRDFALSLEIEVLDARSRLLEKNREVKSLERLSSKGLASAAQLELEKMHKRRAELQLVRFEKQLEGLKRVYPEYFEAPTLE